MELRFKAGSWFLLIGTFSTLWSSIKSNEEVQRGYVLTAPWVFDSDSKELICLTLHGVESRGNFVANLMKGHEVISEIKTKLEKGDSHCLELIVPETSASTANLSISGTFENGYKFRNQRSVRLRQVPGITAIQTDKHIYKPGQNVKFRILQLNARFLPVENGVVSVRIENPFNVKIKEWILPKSEDGITDLSFDLTAQTQLGTWAIIVNDRKKNPVKETFQVEEYVLPRFFVQIYPPRAISPYFEKFEWKVCALYTYKEAVHGQMTGNITQTSPNKQSTSNSQPVTTWFIKTDKFSGCQAITVSKNDLFFKGNQLNQLDVLNFYAEVTEAGTGIKISDIQQVKVKFPTLKVHFLSKRYFKPGLSYIVKVLIENTDDRPVEGEQLMLDVVTLNRNGQFIEKLKHTLKVDKEGFAQYIVRSYSDKTQIIRLTITPINLHRTNYQYISQPNADPIAMNRGAKEEIKSWYSSDNNFIQIEKPTEEVSCNGKMQLSISISKSNVERGDSIDIKVFSSVLARNSIVMSIDNTIKIKNDGSSDIIKQAFDIVIPIDPRMSPRAELLVYFVTEFGEIVSDSETFAVEKCFQNEVEMTFGMDKILPGTNVPIELRTSPKSLCAIGVTDQSAQLLSGREFNAYNIFGLLEDQQSIQPIPREENKCRQGPRNRGNYKINPNLLGSQDAFDVLGVMTMTDLTLESSPCEQYFEKSGRTAYSSGNGETEGSWYDWKGEKPQGDQPYEESVQDTNKRNYFPETWLWELVRTDSIGELLIEREIPHTITNWIGNAFCMSPDSGFGVSPKTSIISFQKFFLLYTMPYSVKFGEIFPLKVTIFKYLQGCVPIVMSLEKSDEFKLTSKASEIRLCLCEGESFSHDYEIRPLKVGLVNITVRATSDKDKKSTACGSRKDVSTEIVDDSITKPMLVKENGFPQETTSSRWICANVDSVTKDFSVMPPGGISGTSTAQVAITGDFNAPTINGLEKLVQLPTRCGEQTMMKFTPMLYTINYLRTTNMSKDEVFKAAKSHLEAGYQNQLNYKRKDGSFSVWGPKDKAGSTWLTAFVIKSFAEAQSIITIDQSIINNGFKFITQHQDNKGCFKEIGKIYHTEMQGRIGKSDKSTHALTLFITIALLEAGYQPSNSVISKALKCIKTDVKPDTYRLAMYAYVAALTKKQNLARKLLKKLIKGATTEGDMTYFENDISTTVEQKIEITSYALLAMCSLNSFDEKVALRTVNWLVSKKNANGGFYSTQDTIIGIQALEKYASRVLRGSEDVTVKLKAEDIEETILINKNNCMKVKTKNIPVSSDVVELEVSGKGCALIQVTLNYFSLENQTSPVIDLATNVAPHNLGKSKENAHLIEICPAYKIPGEHSNMAIVEIEMVTGYEADEASLERLLDSGFKIREYTREDDGRIIIYFEEITDHSPCFQIVVKEVVNITNRQPAVIQCYDYDLPNYKVTNAYSLEPNKYFEQLPQGQVQ